MKIVGTNGAEKVFKLITLVHIKKFESTSLQQLSRIILIVSNVCIFAQYYTYYSHGNTFGMFTQQNYLSILMWAMSQSHCPILTKNRKGFYLA